MLSEASSLVRHQCTRLPKYRCSQRPRPWLDTSAPVCPSIDALSGFVPGWTPVHPSAQVSMLSEALSLVRHQCTRLPKYRCSQRPRPWLDTSAPVCPSIDALRSFRMPFSLSGTVVKATTTTGFGLLLMPDLAICPLSLPHLLLSHSLLELSHL